MSKFATIVSETNNNEKNDPILTHDAEEIKKCILEVDKNTKDLENQIYSIMDEVNPFLIEKKNKIISKILSDNQQTITNAKKSLDNMKEITSVLESPIKIVIINNIHRSLTKQLFDIVNIFNIQYEKYKKYTTDQFIREINIIKPNINEEETNKLKEKLITGEETISSVFTQSFISQEHSKAREKLRYYRELYRDTMILEKQISELKQYFIDCSVLISQQGELINQIEYNVKNSVIHIKKGNNELNKAVSRSNKTCNIF